MISTTTLKRDDSLRDRALRILRQAIVSGEIQAGEIYSATGLARRLEVSVSPVREAMLTLVNAGIMEPVRNRGFRVAELRQGDLDEILELRVLLEIPAMRALASVDLSDERSRLEDLVRANEVCADAGDVNQFLATDRAFHLCLIEHYGNQRLADTVANLRDQTRLYGLKDTNIHTLAAAAAEHRAILEALLGHDEEKVGTLLSAHLDHIRREWASAPKADTDTRPRQ